MPSPKVRFHVYTGEAAFSCDDVVETKLFLTMKGNVEVRACPVGSGYSRIVGRKCQACTVRRDFVKMWYMLEESEPCTGE